MKPYTQIQTQRLLLKYILTLKLCTIYSYLILKKVFNYLTFLILTSMCLYLCFRQNVLRLNIFYRELSYEQITQQEAYEIFSLLCELFFVFGFEVRNNKTTLCNYIFIGLIVLRNYQITQL